jgi:signal transduction histidine kinase
LAEATTFEGAAPRILQVLCTGLGWDLGALWRVDPQAGVLRCVELWRAESVHADRFEAATRTGTFQSGIGLLGRVWTSRAPICVPDVTRDPTFRRAEVAARDGLRSAFACPILLGNEVLGVIDFVSRESHQADQDLLDLMATIGSQIGQFMERKQTENALQLAQAELAHVMRVMTMGELTASIAHEINQPLSALTSNAGACMRWLARQPPDLQEADACLQRIISNSHRAGDVITRIRALVKKSPPVKGRVDLNDAIQEVIALVEPEARRHEVLVRRELASDLPPVQGDRVQLQQVILNLTMNGIEAMKDVAARSRELWIRSCPHQECGVLVSVRDSGIGLDPAGLERVFEAFYTTKAQGMGMGLSISRSIIEAHGGQLWPSTNDGNGATFQFTLPTEGTYDQDTDEVRTGAGLAA